MAQVIMVLKMLSTLLADLALASKNGIFRLLANSNPYLYVTYLLSSRSHLFPTRIFIIFSLACFSIYDNHILTFSNEALLVIS
jgi:hypothetical protein